MSTHAWVLFIGLFPVVATAKSWKIVDSSTPQMYRGAPMDSNGSRCSSQSDPNVVPRREEPVIFQKRSNYRESQMEEYYEVTGETYESITDIDRYEGSFSYFRYRDLDNQIKYGVSSFLMMGLKGIEFDFSSENPKHYLHNIVSKDYLVGRAPNVGYHQVIEDPIGNQTFDRRHPVSMVYKGPGTVDNSFQLGGYAHIISPFDGITFTPVSIDLAHQCVGASCSPNSYSGAAIIVGKYSPIEEKFHFRMSNIVNLPPHVSSRGLAEPAIQRIPGKPNHFLVLYRTSNDMLPDKANRLYYSVATWNGAELSISQPQLMLWDTGRETHPYVNVPAIPPVLIHSRVTNKLMLFMGILCPTTPNPSSLPQCQAKSPYHGNGRRDTLWGVEVNSDLTLNRASVFQVEGPRPNDSYLVDIANPRVTEDLAETGKLMVSFQRRDYLRYDTAAGRWVDYCTRVWNWVQLEYK